MALRARRSVRHQAQPAPILACVDEPPTTEYASRSPRVCRFRGWVVSTRNRPTRITARVAAAPPLEFEPNDSRPDVVEALRSVCRVADPRCGFRVDLELPEFDGDPVPITLEFTDGEAVIRSATYHICPSSTPPPPRGAYKDVWNSVSESLEKAKTSVAGYTDEDRFRQSAEETVKLLQNTVGVRAEDVVLEIGAGVGRVGQALAPLCRKWIGTDVSENMLSHARQRLSAFDNVELIATNGWNLQPIPSDSIDVVYCTVVFMHLDEWERFGYVCEGMRILKPSGRMYADNFNLCGDQGWDFFIHHVKEYHPLDRPPNISKSSTPQELQTYFERAGFTNIGVQSGQMWVRASGIKPS